MGSSLTTIGCRNIISFLKFRISDPKLDKRKLGKKLLFETYIFQPSYPSQKLLPAAKPSQKCKREDSINFLSSTTKALSVDWSR
jgi:hypothetical protein